MSQVSVHLVCHGNPPVANISGSYF